MAQVSSAVVVCWLGDTFVCATTVFKRRDNSMKVSARTLLNTGKQTAFDSSSENKTKRLVFLFRLTEKAQSLSTVTSRLAC